MMRRLGSAGLGVGQLFVLIFGFLITSALIFLFGIWVGRDVAERRLAQEERVVRVPIAVPTGGGKEEKESGVDRTFYQSLKEKAYQRQESPVAATPAAPRATEAPTATPTAVRAAKPTAPPKPALPTPALGISALPTPAIHAKRPEELQRGEEWADAGWTVQVNATTNPQQATELAHGLRAKGYDAYAVQAPMRGQTWYRVRVGRFTSREKAKELETRLKSSEGLDNAYVTPQ